MTDKRIRLVLFWAVITAWALIVFTSCTKRYKCSRYGGKEVVYNPKEQTCYYTITGDKKYLEKEQCSSLCYEY